MKIAFIGQKGIPSRSGGVEKHVENVAVRMAASGHEVFAYARAHYNAEKSLKEYKGVKIVYMPSINTKNLDAITHTFFSTVHALFQGYDVIHFQSIGPITLSFLPKLLAWKTKVVATFHSQDYFHKKWGLFARAYLRFGEYVACKVPQKTIVVSKGLQSYAERRYGAKTWYIPNGSDIHEGVGFDTLASFDLEKKKYVLSVGRLVKHKGVHYLIEAFLNLEDEGKIPNGFKLVIVGKDAETPEYEASLKRMAKGRKNVVFLGERIGEELNQLFANAAFFVQPSEFEGLSIALLESMSYGLPSLASDIEPNVEVIDDAGILFKSEDIADLQEKMNYLFHCGKEIEALGEKAKMRITNHYNWDKVTEETLELYRSLK